MRTVVVTGGTSGIGKGVVEHFAAQGDHVIMVGTREDGSDIASQIPGEVTFQKVDVTDEVAVKGLFGHLGPIGLLVNAAGAYAANDPELGVLDVSVADFERVWRVNVLGTLLCSKFAMPSLVEAGGNIVNISSASGSRPEADVIAYVSSKAAVNGLTKSMALAHAHQGVRVNAVCPGPIDTPMLRSEFPGASDGLELSLEYNTWIRDNPAGHAGTVEDVVGAVAYLDGAGYANGSLMFIDGGWTSKSL